MQITGKTKIGNSKNLTVEVYDIEIVKSKIVKSIKDNETVNLVDDVISLYGKKIWKQATLDILKSHDLLTNTEMNLLEHLVLVSSLQLII